MVESGPGRMHLQEVQGSPASSPGPKVGYKVAPPDTRVKHLQEDEPARTVVTERSAPEQALPDPVPATEPVQSPDVERETSSPNVSVPSSTALAELRARERAIAEVRDAAVRYNELLATLEDFPARYQSVSDEEVEILIAQGMAGGNGTTRSRMRRSNKMREDLLAASDDLNQLWKKVMESSEGRRLFSQGRTAVARNRSMRRAHTNVFDEAARLVESFPYIVSR